MLACIFPDFSICIIIFTMITNPAINRFSCFRIKIYPQSIYRLPACMYFSRRRNNVACSGNTNWSVPIITLNYNAVFIAVIYIPLIFYKTCMHDSGIRKNIGVIIYILHTRKLTIMFIVIINISHIGNPSINRLMSFIIKICSD